MTYMIGIVVACAGALLLGVESENVSKGAYILIGSGVGLILGRIAGEINKV